MLRMRPRALRAAICGAVVMLLAGVLPASAVMPTPGAGRGSFSADQVVYYHWGASAYPSWLTVATQDSLDTKFRNWNANNSRSPRPAFGGGSATVFYWPGQTSPCNTQINYDWLACAKYVQGTSFQIYVRDFVGSKRPTWGWWDETRTCARGGTVYVGCWNLERAVIHEAGHAIPGFGHYDDGTTEDHTVMRSTDPTTSQYGGNHYVFQRCDQAALQKLWDVARYELPYGDCFGSIPGHGVRGLYTTVTTSGTAFTSCVSTAKSVAGRLAVKSDTLNYGPLAGNPLSGRTVWFDRKRHVDATWTTRSTSVAATGIETGYNWTRSFTAPVSTGGLYDYRAHFDGDNGLDPSNQVTFTISWTAGC